MINREMKDITVNIYTTGVDAYGQKRQNGKTTRVIRGVAKLASAAEIDNPKYVDVDMIVLTEDTQLTDANTLVIDNKECQIKYIVPARRYNMVLVKWLK